MNLVSHSTVHSNATIPAGLVLGSIVAITALLVWLTGLILVLRGADPGANGLALEFDVIM